MACATVHLAIAKKYLDKNNNINYEEFMAGTLYPDAATDNDKTHYTDLNRGKDNVSHVRGKVNLSAFLDCHESLSDFELGWFLHLVTDYLFFEECFTTEYLLNNSYEKFCQDLYFAYSCLNSYLTEKYDIKDTDYKNYPSENYPGIPYEDCLLSKEMIDDFIERVSSIDLKDYIMQIKENKKNIKPRLIANNNRL